MKRPDLLSGLSFFISRFNLLIANHPGRKSYHFPTGRAVLPRGHHTRRRGSAALPLHL
jgi:hypothetical protein